MFILSSDIFSHLLLSSIYLTSTSVPFSLSGHPSSSLKRLFQRFFGIGFEWAALLKGHLGPRLGLGLHAGKSQSIRQNCLQNSATINKFVVVKTQGFLSPCLDGSAFLYQAYRRKLVQHAFAFTEPTCTLKVPYLKTWFKGKKPSAAVASCCHVCEILGAYWVYF